jgi:hypothetical protein
VLENGHFEHLLRQPFFFARKLSPHAGRLAAQIHEHVAAPELDWSYFAQVGAPSGHYAKFLARAMTLKTCRSRVATEPDAWHGVMGLNERPYVLLYAASRRLAAAVARQMRAQDPSLPVFDYVFDPLRLVPAEERVAWRGIQCGMRARRDHDAAGFAYELIHLDPLHRTVMCVDAAAPSWLRDFALWDEHATLVCCDPRGLGKLQRAEAGLRDISAMDESALYDQTVRAASVPGWLPQDHFDQAQHEAKHRCRFLAVDAINPGEDDPTLQAVRRAWQAVDARGFFAASEAEARLRLFGDPSE